MIQVTILSENNICGLKTIVAVFLKSTNPIYLCPDAGRVDDIIIYKRVTTHNLSFDLQFCAYFFPGHQRSLGFLDINQSVTGCV